jgi:serine/threonine-protein kinase
MAMTRAGMILGTAAYMAPEQAKGKQADRRADIWAFGVVLFEMLTGKQAFMGETAAETLASVMMAQLPLDKLPDTTPAALRQVVGRCLERDVRKRLQAIGEARIILENPESGTEVPRQALQKPTGEATRIV